MSLKHRILLVDDDEMFTQTLCEQFEFHEELSVDVAGNASTALDMAANDQYDLIILDLELPDQDGRELCRAMRAKGLKTPIIILSGLSSDADTILGLDSGANDYITKPFKFGVLLARIRAQLRQLDQTEHAALKVGPYTMRPSLKLLETEDGEKLRLTEKETAILRYLHRMRGGVVSREVLLNEVWGYTDGVSTHTLETHIYRLRQKIDIDKQNSIIITDGGGYRLVAENTDSTP